MTCFLYQLAEVSGGTGLAALFISQVFDVSDAR